MAPHPGESIMFRIRLAMAVVVGVGAIGLCRAAEDAGPEVAPDWSKYEVVGSAVGEVVKVDAKGLTLRVTWYVPDIEKKKAKKGNRNKNKARGKRPAIGKNQNDPPRMASGRSRNRGPKAP